MIDLMKGTKLETFPESIKRALDVPAPNKAIPCCFLYDARGSALFEEITELSEYYLTRAEREILTEHSNAIAALCTKDTVVIELGSGSSNKTVHVLEAFIRNHESCHYIPIDISSSALELSKKDLLDKFPKNLQVTPICARYQDALAYIANHFSEYHKLILFLGSSIGNFLRSEAATFLTQLRRIAMKDGDKFLLGIDLRKDKDILEAAYDDGRKITEAFIKNILARANTELHADFDLSSFDYHADYLVDEGRVQMSLESKKSQIVNIKGLNIRICFAEGENVHVENSVKYSTSEIEQLAKKSGLVVEKTFFDKDIKFSLSLLTQSSNDIINKRIAELERCWKYSDDFFELLHPSAWLKRPIALRLPFLFYLGHLPAFAHNQICGPHLYASETRKSFNSVFDDIFSRGIDPDVEEPTICHSHPDYPDSWPSIGQILDYRSRVRDIVLSCLPDIIRSSSNLDKELSGDGRVASMVAEHEYMHSETLLYMYHGLEAKFKRISSRLRKNYIFGKSRVEPVDKSILIPDGQVTVGAEIDRLEFGWDNEFPSHVVHVPAFRIDKFAVTNARFLEFVLEKGYSTRSFWDPADWEWLQEHSIVKPLSWQIDPAASTLDVSSIKIETVFGDLIDFDDALEWPVWVSLAEARAFCKWSGKRLPTEEEYLRAAYGRAQVDSENDFPWGNEQPKPSLHGNFGLSSWSPTPVGTYPKGESSFGVDELIGNGWEWTSSTFAGFSGFQAYIASYPGYSVDFFDGKHFVLRGASWATDTSLIRRSFRNWYQAHYPYVFTKFRCVTSI